MTYGIKRCGTWHTPYWRADEIKDNRKIFSKNSDEYTELDAMLFQAILKEELDVPDYAITEKNIKKEFGYEENGCEIKVECLKQIRKHPDYEFKVNDLYTKLLFVVILMECFYTAGFFNW